GGPRALVALLRGDGVRRAKGTAIYTVEQLGDLLVFACALLGILCYALFNALSARLGWMLGASLVLLIGGLGLAFLLAWNHRRLLRLNGHLLARLGVSWRRRVRWSRRVLGFRNALRDSLRLPRRVLWAGGRAAPAAPRGPRWRCWRRWWARPPPRRPSSSGGA